MAAKAQWTEQHCEAYSFRVQNNDSNALGQMHPQLQEWMLDDCRNFLQAKGYCERDSAMLRMTLFIWLSTEDRVVYEEMFTGSPHQLGVVIPNDLGYRTEKIETLKYINFMVVMSDIHDAVIWKNHVIAQAKGSKSKNAERRSRKMSEKLLKGIPPPASLSKN